MNKTFFCDTLFCYLIATGRLEHFLMPKLSNWLSNWKRKRFPAFFDGLMKNRSCSRMLIFFKARVITLSWFSTSKSIQLISFVIIYYCLLGPLQASKLAPLRTFLVTSRKQGLKLTKLHILRRSVSFKFKASKSTRISVNLNFCSFQRHQLARSYNQLYVKAQT